MLSPRCPRLAGVLILAASTLACTESGPPSATEPAFARVPIADPPASELRTAGFGGSSLTLWPWTGSDFSATASDPVNLLFLGQSDPRLLRAALLMLDGDRTAFGLPNQFPFNCTWVDPIDPTPQTTWAEPDGWIGSTIQVECGDFNSIRFHIRLFDAGEWTIGASHLEVRIPGTPGHEIISWELAEALRASSRRSPRSAPRSPRYTTRSVRSGRCSAPRAPYRRRCRFRTTGRPRSCGWPAARARRPARSAASTCSSSTR
jgi:hypothetical protein